jgi:hypothetical protein
VTKVLKVISSPHAALASAPPADVRNQRSIGGRCIPNSGRMSRIWGPPSRGQAWASYGWLSP